MDESRRAALESKIARLSPEKQELLRARLGGTAGPAAADELPPGLGGSGDFAMSETQKGFWFLEQLEPGSPMFHLPLAGRAVGKLDLTALRRAVEEIMRRHDLLRACILSDGGEAMFRVDPAARLPFEAIDLGDFPEAEREAQLLQICGEKFRAPFDFSVGPLLRLLVIREKPEQHVLCFVLHHLICDGWSVELFFRELRALYTAFSADEPSPLPELRWRYADYVTWQQQNLAPEGFAAKLDFWRRALQGAPPLTELPHDRPRPPVASHEGGLATIVVGREEVERVTDFGRRASLTPFMTYLGVFAALLTRWSDQDEVVIGTPTYNRPRAELEQIIGLFVNTIVLRCDLAGNPAARAYLTERIRPQVLDAFAHQDVPFSRVVRVVDPDHEAHHSPLFQVLFTYQSYAVEAGNALGDVALRGLDGLRSKATYDLTFELHNRGDGGISLHCEFATDLFDRSTIVRMLSQYASLLYALLDDPEAGVQSLPLLSAAERRQVVVDWNQTDAAFPEHSTYQELFRAAAHTRPKLTAAREGTRTLSYGELDARSDALADVLSSHGVGRDTLVALVQERGLELLTSIVAVWKAGAAYVPIDPAYPPERIAQIVRRSQAPVVLTSAALERGTAGSVPAVARPGDLAYCIFTSGSTGQPKGAMVEQRGMLNHMFAKIGDLGLTEADVLAGTASPCFDISVWQFFSALLVGGRVVFFDDETTHSPTLFLERLVAEQVTVAEIVPSFLRALLGELEQLGERRPTLQHLRWLMLTGEALPAQLCRRWIELYPSIPLVNAYGPTECSDDVTHHFLTEPPAESVEIVPIGRPIANTRIYVVDRRMTPVPVGVRGEIVVGGAGVGRGYLGDPERTREVFLDDPFVHGEGRKVYRTGDRGRLRADGTLEFLGRLDHQVKIRGFRIEPGEVEAVLARHPDVREAAVVARADPGTELRLVGYVVAATGAEPPGVDALREFLRAQLPEYMVPAVFVHLEALPLTANGKLDRAALGRAALGRTALPRPERAAPRGGELALPATPTERVVAAVWQSVLEVERVGRDENFYDLGGHSLLLMRVLAELRRQLSAEITLLDLFRHTTVRALAAHLDRLQNPLPVAKQETGDQALRDRAEKQKRAMQGLAARRPRPPRG